MSLYIKLSTEVKLSLPISFEFVRKTHSFGVVVSALKHTENQKHLDSWVATLVCWKI